MSVVVIAHRKLRERIDRYKLLSSHRMGVNKMQFQVEFNETDLFVYPDTEFEKGLEIMLPSVIPINTLPA